MNSHTEATDKRLTVLIVDDHPLVRAGFKYSLLTHDYNVLEAESAEQGFNVYCDEKPDVVIMDLAMPGIGGIEGIRKLIAFNSGIKILVLSMRDDPRTVAHAMSLGAAGYLSKNCLPEELITAITHVNKGDRYFSSSLQVDLDKINNLAGIDCLTKREFEVFQYLAQGESVSAIATKLNRSIKTMNNHRSNIMKKLEAQNTTQLALIAQQEGLEVL